MAIQLGEIEYIRYRNGLLRAICRSQDSVLVTWASGFSQGMKSEAWDNREFLERGLEARALDAGETPAAEAFFQGREHASVLALLGDGKRATRPGL